MDLFSRYVFRQVAGNTLLILLTLTAIVWIGVALKQLDLLTSQGQGLFLFLRMTALALPSLIAIIAPIALIIACLHALDRLNGDSELIIMSAAGAPVWRFAKPLLALAALICVLLVVFNFFVMPASLRQLHSYVAQVRSDLISQVIQPGRFSSPEQGLTFHIRARSADNELLDLMVHDERSPERVMTYLAKKGRIVRTADGSFLVMQNGQIHRRVDDPNKKERRDVSIGEFKEYILEITQFGPKTEGIELKPRERYLSELINVDPKDSYFKRYPGRFRSEIHERFASLLYPFVYVLIALNFLGNPRTVRESRMANIVVAFLVAVLIRSAGLAGTNLLNLHAWAVVVVYGIPATAILVAALAAHVTMAPYRRFGLSWHVPAKLLFYKNIFWTASGAKIEHQRGRVG